jgi:hypothetical protein
VFAIFFVQAVTAHLMHPPHDYQEEQVDQILRNFGSVELTIFSLFQAITGGEDWVRLYRMIEACGIMSQAIFLFFIAFFSIAAWNIITSLFIEKAMQVVQPKTRDLMVNKRIQDKADAMEITEMCKKLDIDAQGGLCLVDLLKFIEDDEIMEALIVRDLDIRYPQTLYDMLKGLNPQQSSTSVRIQDFVNVCLKMRGAATRLDLGTFRFEALKQLYEQRRDLGRCLKKVNKVQDAVDKIAEDIEKRNNGMRSPREAAFYDL